CTHGAQRNSAVGRSASPLDADMVQWYVTLWRITWWVFSRLWAPLMAIGLPVLALYGALEPRQNDIAALELHRGEFAFLIGTGGGSKTCTNWQPCVVTPGGRSYLVVPRSLLDGSVFAVRDTEPHLTVERQSGAAVIVIAIWFLCIFGTWYYWIRKPPGHLTIAGAGREARWLLPGAFARPLSFTVRGPRCGG